MLKTPIDTPFLSHTVAQIKAAYPGAVFGLEYDKKMAPYLAVYIVSGGQEWKIGKVRVK